MAGADPEKLMAKADKLLVYALRSACYRSSLSDFMLMSISYNTGLYNKMIRTKLTLTRWSADWRNATQYYEQAATAFRFAKKQEKAKVAFEKASKGQEMLSALEDAKPEEAIAMYTDACSLLEEDGKENMAFDLYRAITNVYIKLEKYTDAATFLLRWAVAANKCNALHSQCKAYLSAIIVYLAAHDFKQAEQCYNDCCQNQVSTGSRGWIDTFLSSDQSHCASKLLSAYREADVEEIKSVAKSSTVSNLDHMIIRLARKLPAGELVAMEGDSLENGEALDEDDLT
ncbi:hypothetical protein L1987_28798 [Smallanthus sonchifolius]|uniref:Uncharacterized protein n=1 Tax=Smallanthus sonchifolius TaxID=185202 RepID=A0ACB9HY86_9ASTR|nr:hypothetical protein L1987_28798 [Smallanthus sonchifolius]